MPTEKKIIEFVVCPVCGLKCLTKCNCVNHLRKTHKNVEDIFNIIDNFRKSLKNVVTISERKNIVKGSNTILERYGVKNISQSEDIKR